MIDTKWTGFFVDKIRAIRQAKSSTIHPSVDLIAIAMSGTILIVGLILERFHKIGTFGVETDFYGGFYSGARNILAGQPYTNPFHPPGYSLVLAAFTFITNDFFIAGKIISVISAALFVWIAYLILKLLFPVRLALIATLLTLLALVPFSFVAASDVLGALVFLLPVWLLLRPNTRSPGERLLLLVQASFFICCI